MLSDEELLDADPTGTCELLGLRAVEAAVRAEQIEKDAAIAELLFPLGSLVLGDAPSKIAAAIRAQLPGPVTPGGNK